MTRNDAMIRVAIHVAHITQRITSDYFVGAYLHGSLAMGAFRPGFSDIDVITVLSQAPDALQMTDLTDALGQIALPQGATGLDLHLVTAADVRTPSPSSRWLGDIRLNSNGILPHVVSHPPSTEGLFTDLAITRERGMRLVGQPLLDTFGQVPPSLVLQSSRDNLAIWAARDNFHDPVGAVLTACRAWQMCETGRSGSKQEAGEWAIGISSNSPLIEAALASKMTSERSDLDDQQVKAFCARVLAHIDRHIHHARCTTES